MMLPHKPQHRHHREKGFTYLWILFAVAMIGISGTVATEVYKTSVQREKEKQLLFIGRQFRQAIQHYYEDTPGGLKQYPDSLESLLEDPRSPGILRHLRKRYRDPMTGHTEWGLVHLGNKIVGVYSLSEKTPLKIANFEASEADFTGKTKYSEWKFIYSNKDKLEAKEK